MRDNYRICIIDNCNNDVPPMNETDIGVGIYTSSETPICEDCYMSNDPTIQAQIKEAENKEKTDRLPF